MMGITAAGVVIARKVDVGGGNDAWGEQYSITMSY
jgi:hypothetical protein